VGADSLATRVLIPLRDVRVLTSGGLSPAGPTSASEQHLPVIYVDAKRQIKKHLAPFSGNRRLQHPIVQMARWGSRSADITDEAANIAAVATTDDAVG
jgi:hypothetical protein